MICVRPVRIKNDEFACGVCINCRVNRAAQWALRMTHELESWDHKALFVTLTYSPENLPEGNTLVKNDIQKFFKRLRKDLGKNRKIRYFCCGEYGEKSYRPHYHAIIYGIDLSEKHFVSDNWHSGFVHIGTVTYDSARYVAEYVNKKITGMQEKEVYQSRGLIPSLSKLFTRFWFRFCIKMARSY